MSSQLNVYIGPFFLVPAQKTSVESRERRCPNPVCTKVAADQGAAYCNRCGHAVALVTATDSLMKAPHPDALGTQWTDYMAAIATSDGRLVWLPNRHDFGYIFSRDNAAPLMTLDASFISQSLEEFLVEHRDIFDAFHAKFGVELVEGFGVVPYYS